MDKENQGLEKVAQNDPFFEIINGAEEMLRSFHEFAKYGSRA